MKRTLQAVALLVAAAVLSLLAAVPASADPGTPAPPAISGEADSIADWPTDLQAIVAGTAAFQKGPWYTDPQCQGHGGNVGIYINYYLQHEKAFMLQLAQSDTAAGGAAKQFLDQATKAGEFDTWPGKDYARFTMPTRGACADTLKQWATPDPTSVWGFKWADTPDDTSMDQMRKIQNSTGDDLDPANVHLWSDTDTNTAYVKARAFYLNCPAPDTSASSPGGGLEVQMCEGWNQEVQTLMIGTDTWKQAQVGLWDKVGLFFKMVGFGAFATPIWVMSAMGEVPKLVGKAIHDAVDYAAKSGMDAIVAFLTSGVVWLWGVFTKWMVNFTTPDLTAGGFVLIYGTIAGIFQGIAFLLWLAALAVAWRRNKMMPTIMAGFKANLGMQFVGMGAFLMVMLARECTKLLITDYTTQIQSSKFAVDLVAINPVVALLVAFFGVLGLLVALIMLIFQVPLIYIHVLFAPVAVAGQAHEATSDWFRKWLFRLLSLAWTPFFMVGISIVAQTEVMPLAATSQQNLGQQMMTVLSGLLLMVLLPTTPWLLSGAMSFTVGHASAAADRIGQNAGRKGAEAGADLAKGGAEAAGRAAQSFAGDTWGALSSMGSNLMTLAGMEGGGGSGGGHSANDAAGSATGSGAGAATGGQGAGAATGGGAGAAAGAGAAGVAVEAGKKLIGGAAQMARTDDQEQASGSEGSGGDDQLGGSENSADQHDSSDASSPTVLAGQSGENKEPESDVAGSTSGDTAGAEQTGHQMEAVPAETAPDVMAQHSEQGPDSAGAAAGSRVGEDANAAAEGSGRSGGADSRNGASGTPDSSASSVTGGEGQSGRTPAAGPDSGRAAAGANVGPAGATGTKAAGPTVGTAGQRSAAESGAAPGTTGTAGGDQGRASSGTNGGQAGATGPATAPEGQTAGRAGGSTGGSRNAQDMWWSAARARMGETVAPPDVTSREGAAAAVVAAAANQVTPAPQVRSGSVGEPDRDQTRRIETTTTQAGRNLPPTRRRDANEVPHRTDETRGKR